MTTTAWSREPAGARRFVQFCCSGAGRHPRHHLRKVEIVPTTSGLRFHRDAPRRLRCQLCGLDVRLSWARTMLPDDLLDEWSTEVPAFTRGRTAAAMESALGGQPRGPRVTRVDLAPPVD